MTDNEIIKALENEIHLVKYIDGYSADNVSLELLQNSIDLINHQKAEIEKLKTENKEFKTAIFNKKQKCKGEAIKEFAEKLKDVWFNNRYDSPDIEFDYFIDNLVKEMVGDTE